MIKWIGLEHGCILPNETVDEIIGISINGRDYINGSDGELCVHIAALKGFKCYDLPPEKAIVLADDFGDDYIDQSNLPGEIILIGSKIHCIIHYAIFRNAFTGMLGEKELAQFKKIYDRGVKRGYEVDITYDKCDCKEMTISLELDSDCDIEYVINYMKCEWNFLSEDEEKVKDLVQLNEKDFTLQYVMPALERRGFMNVRYEHGVSEYGRDVTYQFIDNFNFLHYGAAQIKAGNISGKANGQLSTIIDQIKLAFEMPYIDMALQNKVFISQVVVICSGTYTNNAKEIIIEKLKSIRSVVFLEGQDIIRMLG